jgi:antitoxin VapB
MTEKPMDLPRDHPEVLRLCAKKREKVRTWLAAADLDGVVISRRDNFAWLTCGGDNRIVNFSEMGYGHLVITRDRHYLVSYSMDSDRYMEEQVPCQGYEQVTLFWYEGDDRLRARDLAGKNVGADSPIPGTLFMGEQLIDLHWPLNELEVQRMRWLAQRHGEVLEQVFQEVQPGMTELEILKMLHIRILENGMDLEVPIVGGDERIHKHRHVLATNKRLERYLLLGPVVRKWGLTSFISRSVHFGEPPDEVQRAFLAAATIEGRVISMLKEGLKFSDILANQKKWYEELGIHDGWKFHFQGGPTGYILVDSTRSLTGKRIQCPQAFSWYTTVKGAKVEELTLLTENGPEIVSMGKNWPTIDVQTEAGLFTVPGMLVR